MLADVRGERRRRGERVRAGCRLFRPRRAPRRAAGTIDPGATAAALHSASGAGLATSSVTPSAALPVSSSMAYERCSARNTAARSGPTGIESGSTRASSPWRTCARSSIGTTSSRPIPPASRSASSADGLAPPDGVTPLPHRGRKLEQPREPKEGAAGTRFPRNVANSAIRPAERRGAAVAQSSRDQPQAAHARRADEAGAVPQPLGRLVDPVPEPRLDQPRREPRARRSSRSRWPRTIPPESGTAKPTCSSAAPSPTRPATRRGGDADHVHQRGDPLVGRLADLRQRPGDPGPTAQRGRWQTPASRGRHTPPRSQGRRGHRDSFAIGGSASPCCTPCFPREHNAICDHLKAHHPELGRRTGCSTWLGSSTPQ